MMRTLLDRLLFALPSPPSRASLVRGGLYLLFGLLLYGLFLGVLYMRELIWMQCMSIGLDFL